MSYNDWTLSSKKVLQAFPRLSPSTIRYMPYAIGILGFLGFLDATYLTILHYKNIIPPCSIAHGCETVLTSKYATIAGIPISLLGVIYYLAVLVLAGIILSITNESRSTSHELREKTNRNSLFVILNSRNVATFLVLLTGTGLLVGIFLVILQAFVLHAFCQYCLASEVIDFLLFDCAWWLWRRNG